jgi:hypothetical protein
MLAALRKENREQVKATQQHLKETQLTRKALRRALQGEPQSVPALALELGQPAHEVLWHIAAMKKYGEVKEAGLDEDYEYYLYTLAEGESS